MPHKAHPLDNPSRVSSNVHNVSIPLHHPPHSLSQLSNFSLRLSLSLCALITFCRSISRKIYANSRSYFLHVVESPRDSWKFTSSGELERETRPRNREPSCPVALEAANYFRAASVDGQRNQRERERRETTERANEERKRARKAEEDGKTLAG